MDPGRGHIHLHLLALSKDRAYLDDFYRAETLNAKADIVNKYAREVLDMTADININEDPKHRALRTSSPFLYKFCNVDDEEEDVRKLAEDCMCHHCNKFCMQDLKRNKPRTC